MNKRAETTESAEGEIGRFRALLDQQGLLRAGPVAGVYSSGPEFEWVVQAVDALVGRLADPDAEVMRFPPVMGRAAFETTKYFANFPHLAGTVHCFCGGDDDHARMVERASIGGDWTVGQTPSEVVLAPASCYPLYGIIAARGPLPESGWIVDSSSWCFRHEPSDDPIRMLAFRQREQVCLGTEAHVEAFQKLWVERAMATFRALLLPASYEMAHDPFFGRLGGLMARDQQTRRLKHEIVVPISDPSRPNACGSVNQHGDHFSRAFGIRTADGVTARTACAGLGLERLALALFRHHGFRPESWPIQVRVTLWPES